MIAYHASNKKFDKFSLEQANTRNHKENFKALWFSTDIEYIKQFGKIIYKVNIDTKNFLRESQYNKIDKLVHEFDSTCDDGIGVLETKRCQEFADFLVSKGYDGYIFPQNDGKTIICFNPNAIKMIDTLNETSKNPFLNSTVQEIVYHGTNGKFKQFNPNKMGTHTDDGVYGKGFYFTDDANQTYKYGRNQLKCFINIENPLVLGRGGKYDSFTDYANKRKGVPEIKNMEDYNKYGHLMATQEEGMFFLKEDGYDGIIVHPYNGAETEYVVFKPEQIKIIDNIKENLEELSDGIYATQSAYDILNLFKNKPKAYRVVYDKNNRYYFIGDALKYIHGDLISAAYDMGFYYDELKNNSRSEVMIYLGNCLEYQEVLMLSFFPKDFGDIKAIDSERSSDWYNHKYVYDFGTIYTQEHCPLEEFDLYQLLGKPLEQEELEIPESLNENLEKLENDYGEDIYATEYEYEVVNYCKENKSCLKILYANGWYFIGSAYSLIHNDLKNTAAKNGFFGEVEFKYGNAVVNTEDHDLFTFDVNTDEENARLEDEDKFVYEYPFGLFYTKRHIEETPLYKYLGKPLNIRTLKSIYESLNKELERYLCD